MHAGPDSTDRSRRAQGAPRVGSPGAGWRRGRPLESMQSGQQAASSRSGPCFAPDAVIRSPRAYTIAGRRAIVSTLRGHSARTDAHRSRRQDWLAGREQADSPREYRRPAAARPIKTSSTVSSHGRSGSRATPVAERVRWRPPGLRDLLATPAIHRSPRCLTTRTPAVSHPNARVLLQLHNFSDEGDSVRKRLMRMLLLAAASAVGRVVQKKIQDRNQHRATPVDGGYKTYPH